MAKDSTIGIINAFLRQINAKVSNLTVKKFIDTHPEKSSISCLRDFFVYINATATLAKCDIKSHKVHENAIYNIKRTQGSFALVIQCQKNSVAWIDTNQIRHIDTCSDFLKFITQTDYLNIDASTIKDPDYEQNEITKTRLSSKNILFYAILFTAFIYSAYLSCNNYDNMFPLSKLIGLCICFLILTIQFNGGNSITKKMCNVSSNTNCESVLFSPGAKIFGYIGWSEIGSVYFCSGWFISIFLNQNNIAAFLQCIISAVAFPYIFYSLYYQHFIVRRWCPMCLMVQLILILEASYSLYILKNVQIPYSNLVLTSEFPLILFYAIIATLYIALKPAITSHADLNHKIQTINSFKYDELLFEERLRKQLPCPSWIPNNLITFGGNSPLMTITLLINPFCAACSSVYSQLKVLSSRRHDINFNVIFSITNDKENIRNVVSEELLLLYKSGADTQILDYWFSINRNYDLFENKFKEQLSALDDASINKSIEQHRQWEIESNVFGTPRVFVNGFLLPPFYEAKDLFILLDKQRLLSLRLH